MDIVGFFPSFGGLIWTLLAFIAALSIIVAVHEYGHYIVGRWSGIHAEIFSLGFGPIVFSRVDKRGTRWQIAALPLGGYVKFLGDANAASGKDGEAISKMTISELRHTMHGAPLWARASTVAAGPVFNFALSIMVFAGFFLINGVATQSPVVGGLKQIPHEGQSLQQGDRILAIGGKDTPDLSSFFSVADELTPAPTVEYRVLREGAEVSLQGPFPFPPIVDGVQPQSAAVDAGIEPGDVVQTIDGKQIHAFSELRNAVGSSDGKPVLLGVWRNGETREATLLPRRMDIPTSEGGFETRWLIGLNGGLAFSPETRTPGPLEAVLKGAEQTWYVAKTSVSGLYHMITGAISSCNLRGPIGIAETSGAAASQGAASFIWFIAMLSTAVGLLNLFPVPVLDGGHLVFHAWEAVTGKPPSDRALRSLMGVGFVLLMTLMAFALTNDLFCP